MFVRRFSSLLPVLIIFVITANNSGFGQNFFFSRQDYSVGGSPAEVVIADFNGDFTLDIATLNRDTQTVSVLLGNGDGTFQDAITSSIGRNVHSFAVGDFNNDGIPDLIMADGLCCVLMLLGNGDGTFQPPMVSDADEGPALIAAADFNGDGNLDIVVVAPARQVISIFLGNGDGTIQRNAASFQSVDRDTRALIVADFTLDGIPDVVTANSPSSTEVAMVRLFVCNGDGTIRPGVSSLSNAGGFPMGVGDFNADGMLDLAVPDGDSSVSILFGNGDGTFQPAHVVGVGAPANAAVAADFNNDGLLDFAASAIDHAVIRLGNGFGGFAPADDALTGNGAIAIASADFNGDGLPDLVVVNSQDNSVTVLINSPF